LKDIKALNIDEVISLGDLIGYGPSPAEVLGLAKKYIDHSILGNHDAVFCKKLVPENFNDNARVMLEWSASQVSEKAIEYFSSFPLGMRGDGFRIAHANFVNPGEFKYMLNSEDAKKSFDKYNEPIMFIGHSHIPCIFVIGDSQKVHILPPQNFQMEEGKRYIVNVGSVGDPRDNDPRASYLIYDTIHKNIDFRRIPFDISGYLSDIEKMNSPCKKRPFLAPSNSTVPIIESALIDISGFTPASPQDAVKINSEKYDLERELKKVKRNSLFLYVILFILIIVITGYMWSFGISRTNTSFHIVQAAENAPFYLSKHLKDKKELLPAFTQTQQVTNKMPLKYWSLLYSDLTKQHIEIIKGANRRSRLLLIDIKSSTIAPLELRSTPIVVPKGSRFVISSQIKVLNYKKGFIEIRLYQKNGSDNLRLILHREPTHMDVSGKWSSFPITLKSRDRFKEDTTIFYAIRIQAKGHFQLKGCSLKRKK
jgi:diadenosine tetraphosphatase ApaH/serine/threonine PP2A family protein phosphatase